MPDQPNPSALAEGADQALDIIVAGRNVGVLERQYQALGVLPDGPRDILGIWIETTEEAKFQLKVFADLKTRSVGDS